MNDLTLSESIDQERRRFLKVSAVAGGGLLIGFHLPLANRRGLPRRQEKTSRTPGFALMPTIPSRCVSPARRWGRACIPHTHVARRGARMRLGRIKVEMAPANKATQSAHRPAAHRRQYSGARLLDAAAQRRRGRPRVC